MFLTISLIVAAIALAGILGITDPNIPGPIDTQDLLQASVTKTATFNSTALDKGSGFAPSGGGIPVQAIVPVTAFDFTTGDESYVLKLQESSDNASFTDISPGVTVAAVGTVMLKGWISKRYVRLVATLGGTTPSLTYGAAYLVWQEV